MERDFLPRAKTWKTVRQTRNQDAAHAHKRVTAPLKCHYDENHIFSIETILKHKQVACMRRKMLFTILKYLFLFQRYSSF